MGCESTTHRASAAVWTLSSTSSAAFHPLVQVDRTGADEVAAAVRLSANSGVEYRRAMRTSDDGVTWSTVTALEVPFGSTLGWSYATGFTSITSACRFVLFGLEVRNKTGTSGLLGAQVEVSVETREAP
jgi:hypothetical protein